MEVAALANASGGAGSVALLTKTIHYYMNNLIMGLGLPKGFLMADESDNVRGRALQEQDLVFQRKLPYVQKAYIDGVKKMLLLISYYLGANLDTLRIDVKIKLPHRLSADMLEQYKSAVEYIAELKNLMLEINPYHKLSLEDLNLMVFKAGLDPDIVNIPGLVSQPTTAVEGTEAGFGESLDVSKLPLDNRKKIAESLEGRMLLMLNEQWGGDNGALGRPYAIFESLRANMPKPCYVDIDGGVSLHSRLYECVLKESWLGRTGRVSALDEPVVFFKKLYEAQTAMAIVQHAE